MANTQDIFNQLGADNGFENLSPQQIATFREGFKCGILSDELLNYFFWAAYTGDRTVLDDLGTDMGFDTLTPELCAKFEAGFQCGKIDPELLNYYFWAIECLQDDTVQPVCDLSQPIERVNINGLVFADWTPTPEVGTNTYFYDAPLSQPYDISTTWINQRMPNEPDIVAQAEAAQGTTFELIDANGLPASVSGDMATALRVYASGRTPGSSWREGVHFDVISNDNWLVQHVRSEIVENGIETLKTLTTPALSAVNNFDSIMPIANHTGRLARWNIISHFVISVDVTGNAAAPQIVYSYSNVASTVIGTFIFFGQLVSFEG